MKALGPIVALALAVAGCHDEAPPSAGSAPAASSPAMPGGGPGGGGMNGMGGGGMGGMQGMGPLAMAGGRMGTMQGMAVGQGPGDGTGPGMGPEDDGSRPRFPPWRLTPEAEAELEARRAAMPPPNVPATATELDVPAPAPPGRCAEHQRTHLYVLRGSTLLRSQTIAEAMASSDAVEVPRGGRPSLRTLPLLALVPAEVTTGEVRVYPCVGDPFVVSVEALRAAPSRYALVENRKGLLKLLDATPPEGERQRQLKNIAAIVIP